MDSDELHELLSNISTRLHVLEHTDAGVPEHKSVGAEILLSVVVVFYVTCLWETFCGNREHYEE